MSTASDSEHSLERLHGGWLEHKSSERNKWNPVWCVLKRDGTLFFFSSQETCLNTHIGTLHVNGDSSFYYGAGDLKDGYRFELQIQKKKNKFRVRKPYDRELWRAYILAVITGSVPQDGKLSPQDFQTISDKIQSPLPRQQTPDPTSPTYSSSSNNQHPLLPASSSSPSLSSSPASTVDRPLSVPVSPQLDDGTSSCSSWRVGRQRQDSMPSVRSAGTGSSSEGGFDPPIFGIPADNDSGLSIGGPFMHHKFDKEGTTNRPSWFFEDCSRQLTETILKECVHKGNTLMRVSGSARPNGSYVISKRLESSDAIVHYEVIRVAEGYRINAENSTQTMETLREVMECFIQLSGPSSTHPLQSNDLTELGVHFDAYNRGPILPHPAPSANGSEYEPQDNYEVPQQQNPRGVSAPIPQAPPPPPCPTPSSSSKVTHFSNTRGKDGKAGPLKWQTKENCTGPQAQTMGPAVRRQMTPPDSATYSKPSVMQLHDSLQQQHVVDNLDAVIRGEEEKCQRTGSQQDRRPPVPAVSDGRPKLCAATAAEYYVNASSTPEEEGTESASHFQRWKKRSQSLPFLDSDTLVPANLAPPPVVKPGAGFGAGAGGRKVPPPPLVVKPGAGFGAGKVPPSTAAKTVRGVPHYRGSSLDNTEKVVPNILSELEEKLKQRQEQQPQPSTTTSSNPNPVGRTGLPPPSRPLPAPPNASQDYVDDVEQYEDISQYYQNFSSK